LRAVFIILSISTLSASSSLAAAPWESSTRIGMIQESSSVYDSSLSETAGTMLAFDAIRSLTQDFSIGIRSSGQAIRHGAIDSFRLSTGPAVHMQWQRFRFSAFTGMFRESGEELNGAKFGESTGNITQLSLAHTRSIGPRLTVEWGSSFGRYWGRYERESPVREQRHLEHMGFSRSIDFALRMSI
jgi:hypothetical protein